MNIAIVAPSSVPFVVGGAEKFWWGLSQAFNKYTPHFCELIKIPCRERSFWDLIESYKTFYELDLSHFDMVISTKYPAWMISHDNHLIYLQHTLRGLYDTYQFTNLPTEISDYPAELSTLVSYLKNAPKCRESIGELFSHLLQFKNSSYADDPCLAFPGPLSRNIIHFLDRCAMDPQKTTAYASISENVKNREHYFPEDVDVTVLNHPSDLSRFESKPGKYIFTASRLVGCKRIDLLINAMEFVKEDIPLLISGCGPEMDNLKKLANHDSRIKFLGYISDDKLIQLYSEALVVPFVPRDEDYGLITIEAMMSGKPVVTVKDSGGVCEFIENGVTGYVTEPTPQALGEALQNVVADPAVATEMGKNARMRVENITWESTVNTLLTLSSMNEKKKIVVLNSFPVIPAISGGKKRIYNIFSELSKKYDVTLITYNDKASDFSEQCHEVNKDFREIRVGLPHSFFELKEKLKEVTPASVNDIAAMLVCENDERLLGIIQRETMQADVVICSHPYLYPSIKCLPENTKLIYDAHNVEKEIKKCILGESEEEKNLLDKVQQVERECCKNSVRILCCSKLDADIMVKDYELPEEKLLIVKNGVDTNDIEFVEKQTRLTIKNKLQLKGHISALFIGSYHQPNISAVEEINKLAMAFPKVLFFVTGTVCNAFEKEDVKDNVILLGRVSEKEKKLLLGGCDIGLNPMVEGSGSNLKLVEYAASGLNVLSTSFGMRGLECLEGLIYSCEASSLEETFEALLDDIQEYEPARKTRAVVEQAYSWEMLVAPLASNIKKLIEAD